VEFLSDTGSAPLRASVRAKYYAREVDAQQCGQVADGRTGRHDAMIMMMMMFGLRAAVMVWLVYVGLRPLALQAADARDHCKQVRSDTMQDLHLKNDRNN